MVHLNAGLLIFSLPTNLEAKKITFKKYINILYLFSIFIIIVYLHSTHFLKRSEGVFIHLAI